MPIQQVSFQNTSIAKQNQPNSVGSHPIATSSVGDTVEISTKKKTKENKALKYTLIGVGALLGIIAIIKHKSIVKIFEKASDVEPDIKPPSQEIPKSTSMTSHHSASSSSGSYTEVPSTKIDTTSVPSAPKNKTEASTPIVEAKNKVDIVQNIPSTLVPLKDVLKASGIENKVIEGSKDKNYQLWHFTSPAFFNKFIEMHPDISDFCKKANVQCHDIISLREKINDVSRPNRENYTKLAQLVKDKSGVDLLGEFKHYRFISQGELDAIKTGQPVKNINSQTYSYVTLCPDYGLSCNTFDYRITYKNTPNVLDNLDYYHDTQYKNGIKKPYSHADVEKVEKLVDGKWQTVDFSPKDTPRQKVSPQKTENTTPLVSRVKKISDMDVRSFVQKSLDTEHKYKLSDSERAVIQQNYGGYSQKYIENLCQPIDENGIQFMTKLINICDGKYSEYWKSNPDKLFLITNTGSLHNKIDKNLSEAEWDIIINSFKTLFDGKADAKTIEAVVKYKGTDFDNVNGTIIHQNHLDKILKSLDKKESLSNQEIQKIKFKLNYLRDILDSQLFINELSFKESHIAIYKEFNKICNSLNKDKFNVNDINQFQNRLLNYKNSIINLGTEKSIQDKTRLITELIGHNGEVLDGVKLNRVERSLNGSILSSIEVDGQPLSELMTKAKTDENARSKISTYLNNNQPILERDSFMSTSLPLANAFHDNAVCWKLTPQKGVKGIYIEDAYDILRERKEGREAEVLIQRGSKVQVKKAEFKNGVWQLEGIITPAENLS